MLLSRRSIFSAPSEALFPLDYAQLSEEEGSRKGCKEACCEEGRASEETGGEETRGEEHRREEDGASLP